MFYWIASIFIVSCLVALIVIVARKFPQLTLIDTRTLPKERETKKKKEIIHDRVGRLMAGAWKRFAERARPVLQAIRMAFRRQYWKVLQLDRKYQGQKPEVAPAPLPVGERRVLVAKMLEEALTLVKDGQQPEAEKKYIEIIKIDGKNTEAYRGLGDLYLDAKNHAQARETFEFLVKMSVRDCCAANKAQSPAAKGQPEACAAAPAVQAEIAKNYVSLSLACKALGDLAAARLALESAVAHEPANPKHLDLLIEACILEGDKQRALEVFEKFKLVNPENQKLGALYERILALPAGAGLKSPKPGK